MKGNTRIFGFLVLALAALSGCSSAPPAQESKRALDKIQGKAQVLVESGGASDAGLNAGGSSVYLWEGTRRYRLFLRTPVEVVHGREYAAEGIWAQKAIDEIGDPDQGKNGYPLEASCGRVVKMVWGGLAFDVTDGYAALVKNTVKRYPARPLFLVSRIEPVTITDTTKKAAEKNAPEVDVPADKQKALLVEGPVVQPAPLWEPAGGTVKCKVTIDQEGKISELSSGTQLCEAVPWDKFRYQPPVKGGHPVKVNTEVEVRFEARK